MYQYHVDLSTFVDIPPVCSYFDHPRVLISGKGNISLNSSMQKKVGEQREFHVRISPDGRYLALFPDGPKSALFQKRCQHLPYRAFKAAGIQRHPNSNDL